MGESPTSLINAVNTLSDEQNADVFLYSGEISYQGARQMTDIICQQQERENAFLLLATNGGDPNAGYKIARALRSHYDHLTLYIPGICKSAGTLIALGADTIVLSDFGELGPLDIQLGHGDELWELVSGLNLNEALLSLNTRAMSFFRESLVDMRVGSEGTISTKLAAEMATNLSVGLYKSIYSQVDPVKLGEIERAVKIAFEYGSRLNDGNLKQGALETLVAGYPSHGFVIDITEAETLFNDVRRPNESERTLVENISDIAITPSSKLTTIKISRLERETIDEEIDEEHGNEHEPENSIEPLQGEEGAERSVDVSHEPTDQQAETSTSESDTDNSKDTVIKIKQK